MKILRMVSLADLFTLINALLGFSAMLLVVEGYPLFAVYTVLLGILCDGLDGLVARRFSRKWYLGDYLDVMADTTSFCVAPAAVVFVTSREELAGALGGYHDAVLFGACALSVVCGLLRLARFCYQSGGRSGTFTGLPTPGSALVICLLVMQGELSSTPLPALATVAATGVLAVLMVSDLRYPKVRGLYALATGITVVLMMASYQVDGMRVLSEFLLDLALVMAVVYAALGPLAVRLRLKLENHERDERGGG